MSVALFAHRRTPTNAALARAHPDVRIVPPALAVRTLTEGDTAIARLDVAERLDGIEIGLWELARLEGAGVRVLNRPAHADRGPRQTRDRPGSWRGRGSAPAHPPC